MQDQQHMTAGVDESGTHDLNVGGTGVSSLFVCTAAVVDSSVVPRVNALVAELQKVFFSGGELKSSGIRSNHKRRLKLLNAMTPIPFGYYATIIDKARIAKDSGLRFKPSFYKRMNRMLYERLLRGIASLHVVAHEYGSKGFMDSFDAYLKKKAMPTLYTNWTQEFRDSASTPLIQVADIIAGSLSWCFDPDKDCGEYRGKFLAVLQQKELGVETWPPRIAPIPEAIPSTRSEWDVRIRTICQNTIVRFIDQFSGDLDKKRQMQVAVLRHMLFLDEHETVDVRARHSESLIKHLTLQGFEKIGPRNFRQSIIGPLRDAGVIIAGDRNGYRLAMSVSHVNRYIRHDRSIVEPMLARLQKGRSLLKTGTANQFDMLVLDEFTVIRELVQTFSTVSTQYAIADPSEDTEDQEDTQ